MDVRQISDLAGRITANISKVIIGKPETLELLTAAVIASGHVLLDDVPGTGKTVTAKALAKSLDCPFSRIQFTPDLLPSDITGMSVFNQKEYEFEFRPGPVFTGILLADEINRATPRTQSALLECMQERQVTTDGVTRQLPNPFFVIATENPIETSGTYSLPEAQLDRFLMRLSPGYPDTGGALAILDRFITDDPLSELSPVASAQEIVEAQSACRDVAVSLPVRNYIVALCQATRTGEEVALGISPRGMLSLMRACQAYAAVKGRQYATPDDVKLLSAPVLAHRIIMRNSYLASDRSQDFLATLLSSVPVPTENPDSDAL